MDIQRLRNLTTALLHTSMEHISEDLELITGMGVLSTHMLPRAWRAVEPWLQENVKDARFWDGEYDVTHVGEYELPTPTKEERTEMLKRYMAQPDPLAGKPVVIVNTGR